MLKTNEEIRRRVELVYQWLDERLVAKNTLAGNCSACGRCCDFESFDHRLFVTTPEVLYLADKMGSRNIKQVAGGRCGYLFDGKCTIYRHRFAACRIFCCGGDAGFQSELAEEVVKKFKALCEKFDIPYRYADLSMALKQPVSIGQPADKSSGGGRAG